MLNNIIGGMGHPNASLRLREPDLSVDKTLCLEPGYAIGLSSVPCWALPLSESSLAAAQRQTQAAQPRGPQWCTNLLGGSIPRARCQSSGRTVRRGSSRPPIHRGQSMPEQRLVEHVTSEYNSSAAFQVGFMRLFAQTCFGTSVTWEGHPGIRCSGSYRPLDPGKVAFETIRTLGVSEYSDALQSVLVVGVSPTHLYIVDAVATSKSAVAVGSMFVRSFDVLMPHEA
jgi:hypothetical protein